MNLLAFLVARLKEPSSWAGISALVAAAGLDLSVAQTSAIATAGVAVAGLVAVFLPEGGSGK